ncbi:MAG: hypothetical protein K0R38_1002 [Polyangiaceae bacterium]|jgi:hypothetical protein|nr:hypothetical protein [Polyangiaceae bacterium]
MARRKLRVLKVEAVITLHPEASKEGERAAVRRRREAHDAFELQLLEPELQDPGGGFGRVALAPAGASESPRHFYRGGKRSFEVDVMQAEDPERLLRVSGDGNPPPEPVRLPVKEQPA